MPSQTVQVHEGVCVSTTQRENNGSTGPRAASFAGKALALAEDPEQGLSPPHGPYREGRTAAPPRTLPRTVRSGRDCRLFYAPHSNTRQEMGSGDANHWTARLHASR